jgi:hypothetical protein
MPQSDHITERRRALRGTMAFSLRLVVARFLRTEHTVGLMGREGGVTVGTIERT